MSDYQHMCCTIACDVWFDQVSELVSYLHKVSAQAGISNTCNVDLQHLVHEHCDAFHQVNIMDITECAQVLQQIPEVYLEMDQGMWDTSSMLALLRSVVHSSLENWVLAYVEELFEDIQVAIEETEVVGNEQRLLETIERTIETWPDTIS